MIEVQSAVEAPVRDAAKPPSRGLSASRGAVASARAAPATDGLSVVLARAVAARGAGDAATRDFQMGGRQHSLTLVETPEGQLTIMASTPEDVRVKLDRVHRSITLYAQRLKDADLADDPRAATLLADIAKLQEEVTARVGKFALAKYQKQVGTKPGAWGKLAPVLELDQEKVDADDAYLATVAAKLVDLAAKSGLEGLDPDDLEVWVHRRFMRDVVEPKQAAVAGVIAPFVPRIEALFPGCTVKFRGSLARGLKSFRKPHPTTGGVQRFDPAGFDADAFVEVSKADWDVLVGLGATGEKLTLAAALALAKEKPDADYARRIEALRQIQGQIQRKLKSVAGYQGEWRGKGPNREWYADFYLVLQPATTSASQIDEGNPYPAAMLEKAGMLAIGERTKTQARHGEFAGVAKFLNETHVRVHSDASLTKTSTWGAWI